MLLSEEAIKLVINTEDEDLLVNRNEPISPTKGRTPRNLSKSNSKANLGLVDTFKRRQRGLNTLKAPTSDPNSPAARSRNGSDFDHAR